jgi:hypothetical protein
MRACAGYDYVVKQPHWLIPPGMGAPTKEQLMAAALGAPVGAEGASSGASGVVVRRLHRLNQLHLAMDDRLHEVRCEQMIEWLAGCVACSYRVSRSDLDRDSVQSES